jgi:2-iminobutanoate/2-iminopropanoate deaminase
MKKLTSFHLAEAAERGFAYAQAVGDGDRLYVAGTLSLDDAFVPVAAGEMRGQLEQIYARIGATLKAHGLGFESVLKETVFVTNIDAFIAANDVRVRTYSAHAPACTAVEVRRLAFPECMAEIELVASLTHAGL